MAAPYLLLGTTSTDLAAQTFRADLWGEHGFVLWSEAWYSGHLIPGYSLVFPPLGALLGPRLVGVLAAAIAAGAFAALVRAYRPGRAALLASLWFALIAGANVYTGRITFLLGFAIALIALAAARRRPIAAAFAAFAALASPVAGFFAAIAGAALILSGRVRDGLAIALGATIATLVLVVAFPVGGAQPFGFSTLWVVALACIIALVLLPAELRTLRIGVAIYAILLIALFIVPTPLGNNAPRLGAVMSGPIVALALLERRPRLLALLALPILYWQLSSPVGDTLRGQGEPSTEASFYAPLLEQLDARAGDRPVRVEVLATRERWESVYVAEHFPLARGWLRQLESTDIGSFTDGNLTPELYRDWLTDHGVSYVALPRATLDYISEDESELLLHGDLPFLREIPSGGEDWTLWEVLPPDSAPSGPGAALADGGARVTELGPDGFSVEVPGPGEYLLRMRYTSYFDVAAGNACLEDAGEGSTRMTVPDAGAGTRAHPAPQTVEVDVRLSLDGFLGADRSCSG